MSHSSYDPPRLTGAQRILLAFAGLSLLSLLIVAVMLQPSADGYGTHRQLGLPPCSARVLWGIRCPACGMTTAWANWVRARPVDACRANLSGTLLALAATGCVPWFLWVAFRGRPLGLRNADAWALALLMALVALMFLEWIIRLFREMGS